MVPEAPFPHGFAGSLTRWLDLHERVRQEVAVAGHFRPATGADCLLGGLAVPDNEQHVAIGQARPVVVRKLLGVVELEIPDHFAIPGEFLNSAADTWSRSKDLRVFAD